ncbi:MAG: SH3-like domain-containing protein [Pseudomonadota bacterium]
MSTPFEKDIATDGPLFSVGERVRVDDRRSLGHCRTPFYLRGKEGEVIAIEGPFRDPEKLAYHKPGLPAAYLYRVRFKQDEMWHGYDGSARDRLEADLFEPWLQKASESDIKGGA